MIKQHQVTGVSCVFRKSEALAKTALGKRDKEDYQCETERMYG